MRSNVPGKMITGMIWLSLAGGVVLLMQVLRKRKAVRQQLATAEAYLEHTSPERGYSRWSANKCTTAAGSLGAASH